MTAHAEWLFAPRSHRAWRLTLPSWRPAAAAGERPVVEPAATRVELERLHPRQRSDLGLPEPEPDLASVLERLRLR